MPMMNRYSAPKQYQNRQEFTASGSHTVAAGVTQVRIRAVGGGGGGLSAAPTNGGSSGLFVEQEIAVTPGQVLTVTVGAGGAANMAGGDTSVGAVVARGGLACAYAGGSGSGWGNYGRGGSPGSAGVAGYASVEW